MSKYKSPWSVAHRKDVVISSNDPRAKKIGNYKSKIGSKLIVNGFHKSKNISNT